MARLADATVNPHDRDDSGLKTLSGLSRSLACHTSILPTIHRNSGLLPYRTLATSCCLVCKSCADSSDQAVDRSHHVVQHELLMVQFEHPYLPESLLLLAVSKNLLIHERQEVLARMQVAIIVVSSIR